MSLTEPLLVKRAVQEETLSAQADNMPKESDGHNINANGKALVNDVSCTTLPSLTEIPVHGASAIHLDSSSNKSLVMSVNSQKAETKDVHTIADNKLVSSMAMNVKPQSI